MRQKTAPALPEEIREIWQRGGDVRRKKKRWRNEGEEEEEDEEELRLEHSRAVVVMQIVFISSCEF